MSGEDPVRVEPFASGLARAAGFRRLALGLGCAAALLGICAGIVQLAYGSSIPDWTGNKTDTTGLGLATIGLSLVAVVSVWRLTRDRMLWKHALWAAIALASAIVCFTTVGRLWYVPGPLLILATALAFVERSK